MLKKVICIKIVNWEDWRGKYEAWDQEVWTKSSKVSTSWSDLNIFSHPAWPHSVNKHFLEWSPCAENLNCNRLGAYGSYTNKINSTIKTWPLFFSSQNEQHTLYHETFCFPDLFFFKFLQKALWVQGQTAFHGPPQVNPFHHTLISFHKDLLWDLHGAGWVI